jgi:hypothetical protein
LGLPDFPLERFSGTSSTADDNSDGGPVPSKSEPHCSVPAAGSSAGTVSPVGASLLSTGAVSERGAHSEAVQRAREEATRAAELALQRALSLVEQQDTEPTKEMAAVEEHSSPPPSPPSLSVPTGPPAGLERTPSEDRIERTHTALARMRSGRAPDETAATEMEVQRRSLSELGPRIARGDSMAQAQILGATEDGFVRTRSVFSQAGTRLIGLVLPPPRKTARHLVPLYSTACSLNEYARLCPADLKNLGLLERVFDKWPEAAALQQAAARIVVSKMPSQHHAATSRAGALLARVGCRRARDTGTAVAAAPRVRRKHVAKSSTLSHEQCVMLPRRSGAPSQGKSGSAQHREELLASIKATQTSKSVGKRPVGQAASSISYAGNATSTV